MNATAIRMMLSTKNCTMGVISGRGKVAAANRWPAAMAVDAAQAALVEKHRIIE